MQNTLILERDTLKEQETARKLSSYLTEASQYVVNSEHADRLIAAGYKLAGVLPNGKVILERITKMLFELLELIESRSR